MDNKRAIEVLKGIIPASENDIRKALIRAISSLNGESKNVKEVHIKIIHMFPKLPSLGQHFKELKEGDFPFLDSLFGDGKMDKFFGE